MYTAIKHPVPDRVKPLFVVFDIWALWLSGMTFRVPGCQKLQMMCCCSVRLLHGIFTQDRAELMNRLLAIGMLQTATLRPAVVTARNRIANESTRSRRSNGRRPMQRRPVRNTVNWTVTWLCCSDENRLFKVISIFAPKISNWLAINQNWLAKQINAKSTYQAIFTTATNSVTELKPIKCQNTGSLNSKLSLNYQTILLRLVMEYTAQHKLTTWLSMYMNKHRA